MALATAAQLRNPKKKWNRRGSNLEPEQFCGDDERRFLGCENRKAVLFLFQVLCEFSILVVNRYEIQNGI